MSTGSARGPAPASLAYADAQTIAHADAIYVCPCTAATRMSCAVPWKLRVRFETQPLYVPLWARVEDAAMDAMLAPSLKVDQGLIPISKPGFWIRLLAPAL